MLVLQCFQKFSGIPQCIPFFRKPYLPFLSDRFTFGIISQGSGQLEHVVGCPKYIPKRGMAFEPFWEVVFSEKLWLRTSANKKPEILKLALDFGSVGEVQNEMVAGAEVQGAFSLASLREQGSLLDFAHSKA